MVLLIDGDCLLCLVSEYLSYWCKLMLAISACLPFTLALNSMGVLLLLLLPFCRELFCKCSSWMRGEGTCFTLEGGKLWW